MSAPFKPGETTPRIYVSCASAELDRAVRAMAHVRALGGEVVGDWTPAVATFGSEAGVLSRDERSDRATEMLEHVASAHALVFLDPPSGIATKYAWLEAGVAWGRMPIVVSTPGPHLPFGLSFAHHAFTDASAVELALRLVRRALPPVTPAFGGLG